MKSIEQLKAEAEAAQAAVAEAEKVAREKARKAKDELEQAERKKKHEQEVAVWRVHAENMVEALKKEGFSEAFYRDSEDTYRAYPRISVGPNRSSRLNLQIEAVYRTGAYSYRSSVTGHKIRVGTYGDYKDFRLGRDRKFKYEKIAKELATRRDGMLVQAQMESERAEAKDQATKFGVQIRKACGLNSDDGMVCGSTESGHYDWKHRYVSSTRMAKPGHVLYCVGTLELTPDKALGLTKALRELGLIGDKNLLVRDA